VTRRSLAAATCAGVTAMTRGLDMSASGDWITLSLKATHLRRTLRICKPDRRAVSRRMTRFMPRPPNVADIWILVHNWDPGVTIGIGPLTISHPLWSTRRDWQDAACAEPYRNRGPETVRQVTTSALPMRLGDESGP
jgi:hypothetical protein